MFVLHHLQQVAGCFVGQKWVDLHIFSHNQELSNFPILWLCFPVCCVELVIIPNTTLNSTLSTWLEKFGQDTIAKLN